MKKIAMLLSLTLLLACATFVQTARKTLYGADILADSAMKGWSAYYHEATNNPAQFHETLADVERQHQQVNATAKDVGAALATAHNMVDAYEKGLTTKTQVQSAIDAAVGFAPSLVRLVVSITGQTNLLSNLPKNPTTFTPVKQ